MVFELVIASNQLIRTCRQACEMTFDDIKDDTYTGSQNDNINNYAAQLKTMVALVTEKCRLSIVKPTLLMQCLSTARMQLLHGLRARTVQHYNSSIRNWKCFACEYESNDFINDSECRNCNLGINPFYYLMQNEWNCNDQIFKQMDKFALTFVPYQHVCHTAMFFFYTLTTAAINFVLFMFDCLSCVCVMLRFFCY